MEKIGGTSRGITTVANNEVDEPQDIDPSKWKYYSNGAWRYGDENDVVVKCTEFLAGNQGNLKKFVKSEVFIKIKQLCKANC